MKYVSSPAVVKFRPAGEKSCSGHPGECFVSDPLVYDEKAFNKILVLERKRSERSRKPFMLMLLSLDGLPGNGFGGQSRAKVFSCLASITRDIDVLGWYRQDSVAGIIFTEISSSNDQSVCERIGERIKANLASQLGPEGAKMVRVSFCYLPEKPGGQVFSGLLALYPDILERLDSHKKSLFVKRVLDVCAALIALVLLSPLFLIISLMIKLTTKGPVFFRQERVGQHGKTFTFLKFRSMYVNNDPSIHMAYTKNLILAEQNGGGNGARKQSGVFKILDDPRVTPVGKFLRKSSLDEIPQFINVFAGDMSLVGPRPPIPYELENYDLWHFRRVLGMKPGITGLWQVGGRSSTTFDEMVRLDIHYMTHWSLWLDLKLILKTPLAVLGGKGAY